jgi:orotidine-5'-phosphate decarboxylase
MTIPRLIVALDVPAIDAARGLVQRLGDACDFYKVGSELFTAAGPGVVRELREAGKDVFLDVKLHDIPNTVRGACRSAAALGVRLVTVHASGGRAMLEAAVEGSGGTGVLAVTVLTSLDAGALAAAWGRPELEVAAEVLRLSEDALEAGAHGVVCAGPEVALVRSRHGGALAVLVPGLRPAGAPVDDQSRTVTPAEATAAGASYLVVGRAVTKAPDPRGALERMVEEVRGAARAGSVGHR